MSAPHVLVVVATEREAHAVRRWADAEVVVSGVGRVNAACATTEALLRHPGAHDAVISTGIAGALPGSGLTVGDGVVASTCVYVEEGLITPEGFRDMRELGFPLGDFDGNCVPVDPRLAERFRTLGTAAPIATVATCSGTDVAARQVAERTGAAAEAMEGAAVVHAARRLGVAGIEWRVISNTTGDRAGQTWDVARALERLADIARGL